MKMIRSSLLALLVITAAYVPLSSKAQTQGKVLVVLSSAHELELRDGKKMATGFYLNEFAVPIRKLIAAGYTPVIADPLGNAPTMDAYSNNKMFFGGDDHARADALLFVQGYKPLEHPKTLAAVAEEGIGTYVGIFVPGGHAPMVDLITDKNLGTILMGFHEAGKPTGLICHGPVALLSTVTSSVAYRASLVSGDGSANKLAANWPYAGYRLTVFSTGEEEQTEGPKGIGGYLTFYPVNALAEAGGHVDSVASWHSNVVEDRELLTAQQPMSADEFGDAFVLKLNASSK